MEYEVIIGLEVHAELLTRTKIYCGCTTEFGGEQNTHCCPVCMGLPGALPVLNRKVVEYAVKAGLALNCYINRETYMSRKNYFYPDCPKNYQITQEDTPICSDGYIELESDNEVKRIGIHRIHIEEDAGKAIHREDGSYIDYNRAGVPLAEIVSRPDIHSPREARIYMEKLKAILQYIGVSDCKMEEGSLRCDANISLRPVGLSDFGVKTEIKNMNSFKALERALEYEIERQKKTLENGGRIIQETRRWNDEKNITEVMRSKEKAHDYRYFPEPDMVYIRIDDEWINRIKSEIPELPAAKKKRYIKDFSLPEYDSEILTLSKPLSSFFEECVSYGGNPKDVSNWVMGEVMRSIKEKEIKVEDMKIKPAHLVELIGMIDKGIISGTIAKKVFNYMFETGKEPEEIVKEKKLAQVSDEGEIKSLIDKVIYENPQSVVDYNSGKTKAVGFIIGQVMKASKGKANPKVVNRIVLEELNRR